MYESHQRFKTTYRKIRKNELMGKRVIRINETTSPFRKITGNHTSSLTTEKITKNFIENSIYDYLVFKENKLQDIYDELQQLRTPNNASCLLPAIPLVMAANDLNYDDLYEFLPIIKNGNSITIILAITFDTFAGQFVYLSSEMIKCYLNLEKTLSSKFNLNVNLKLKLIKHDGNGSSIDYDMYKKAFITSNEKHRININRYLSSWYYDYKTLHLNDFIEFLKHLFSKDKKYLYEIRIYYINFMADFVYDLFSNRSRQNIIDDEALNLLTRFNEEAVKNIFIMKD